MLLFKHRGDQPPQRIAYPKAFALKERLPGEHHFPGRPAFQEALP
jgi:hypothetical protein